MTDQALQSFADHYTAADLGASRYYRRQICRYAMGLIIIFMLGCSSSSNTVLYDTKCIHFKCDYAELYVPEGYKLDSLVATNFSVPLRYEFKYPNGNYIYVALGPLGDLFFGKKIDTLNIDDSLSRSPQSLYSDTLFFPRGKPIYLIDMNYDGFESGEVIVESFDSVKHTFYRQIITPLDGATQSMHNVQPITYHVIGYLTTIESEIKLYKHILESVNYHKIDYTK